MNRSARPRRVRRPVRADDPAGADRRRHGPGRRRSLRRVGGPGPALNLLAQSPIRTITDLTLSLIPFFVLMGVLATNSGMSRELFRTGQAWFGSFRGGMALSTIGACAGFAAICGSSVATAATMTKIALPEMKRVGYRDDIATGVIAAGGTLGILIPPSVVLAIYAFITEQDVGKLFIAGIVPGVLAMVMYMAHGALRLCPDPAGRQAFGSLEKPCVRSPRCGP